MGGKGHDGAGSGGSRGLGGRNAGETQLHKIGRKKDQRKLYTPPNSGLSHCLLPPLLTSPRFSLALPVTRLCSVLCKKLSFVVGEKKCYHGQSTK